MTKRKRIFKVKQSSTLKKGHCYGYSTLWAKNQDNILPNPQPKIENELSLNETIKAQQASIKFPNYSQRLPDFYQDKDRDTFLINMKSKLENIKDAVIIIYFGPIASHAIAIKKINENTYHYFDCNDGVDELNEDDLNTFPEFISSTYKKDAYGMTFEYIPADQNFEPDFIENIIATTWISICVDTMEIIRNLQALLESVINVISFIHDSICEHLESMVFTLRLR